jgi:succinate dehydrogenase / fumarate reductase, cytochrome b subunit
MEDIRDAMLVGRNSEGKKVLRPVSPHLQVYRFKITMAQSILHRITGSALAVGAVLMVAWLAAAASNQNLFALVQGLIASPFGLLALFGFTLALFYHLAAGLRHLAWDAGWGFEKPQFNATSVWIFVFTFVATAFVWVAGYFLVQG